MFCTKCGSKMNDGMKFCTACGAPIEQAEQTTETGAAEVAETAAAVTSEAGEAVGQAAQTAQAVQPAVAPQPYEGSQMQNSPAAPSKQGGKGIKIPVIIGAAVVLIALIAIIASMLMNSGWGYVAKVVTKSQQHYKTEANHFVESNPVLKTTKDYLKGSYEISVYDDYGNEVFLANDNEKKAFEAYGQAEYMPVAFSGYITNESVILGVADMLMVEIGAKDFKGDLGKFIDNSADDEQSYMIEYVEEYYNTLPDNFDFSYDAIFGANNANMLKKTTDFQKKYNEVFKKLLTKGTIKKSKDSVRIGDKEEKTTHLQITYTKPMIEEWVKNDFVPALKADKELEDLFLAASTANLPIYYSTSYEDFIDSLDDFEEFIEDDIDDGYTMVAELDIIKNVIVQTELVSTSGEDYDDFSIKLSALGEKYRLENVEIATKLDDETAKVKLSGELFDTDKIKADVIVEQYGSKEKIKIDWDTKEEYDNFVISGENIGDIVYSASVDEEGVAYFDKYDEYGDLIWAATIDKLNEKISVPSDTIKLAESSIDELTNKVSEISGSMY